MSIIYLFEASLTFKGLPFRGKTPNLSLPTISIPAIAKALAESPSVIINVHSEEFLDPASLASSNLLIPVSLVFFLPYSFLFILAYSFAYAAKII